MTTADPLVADYRHLREDAGAYRLPRDVVRLEGPDAASYLQGQCSQDLADLAPGASADTLLLAPDGKINALARVIRLGAEVFHLDVDGGHGDAVLERLARFKLRSRFDLGLIDWSCVALRGKAVPERAELGAPALASFSWNGWQGVDLLGPSDSIEVPPWVPWCSQLAWEAARIESGIPVMGRELTEGVIPAETGIVERTVSFTKGCFTGQELVARIDSRGASVPHRLCGLVLDEVVDPDELADAALAVEEKEKPIGRVTSAARCPGVGAVCALAYLHRSVAVPGRVLVHPTGANRSDALSASVRPLPLV
ncbi:MAG TPA: glycine cleavage T C-terminal barrel domain-containing protein [Acidimicrobiales bacterium]|nr:glycine cleavage T C-terminal barrel domain-containing protein [Acidimicrobiales bacterium]